MASRGTLHRIAWRLPLTVLGLLVLQAIALVWWAYREVAETSLAAAEERLGGAADRLAGVLGQQITAIAAQHATIASDSVLRQVLLQRGSVEAQRRAESVLAARLSTAVHAVILRDRSGTPVLAVGDTAHAAGRWIDSTPASTLWRERDTTFYSVRAAIASSDTLGVLEQIQILSANPGTRALIAGLIGSHAAFVIGNRDGSFWTDLEGSAPGPDSVLLGRAALQPRGSMLGMPASIASSPWSVWMEQPAQEITGRARVFLLTMITGAGGILALGVVTGLGLSRGITTRLTALTSGARAMSRGQYAQRLAIEGHDEVAELGSAFNDMALRVHQSTELLEATVAERTRDLEASLRKLEQAQEALVRREKLAVLGQLASGVGHELRNPLGVMTNAVYYLEAVQTGPPAVKEYLQILREQIALAERIISDLLDYARVREPDLQAVRLDQLLTTQLGRLRVPEGVAVRTVDLEHAPMVLADPVQIGQIALNLLSNAFQAVEPTGGTVTVGASVNAEMVSLDVSDDGPGMSPEVLAKIFEPLFTTKPRGMGLGLAVSRALAEANHGQLTAESVPGKGARFRLILPRAPQEG